MGVSSTLATFISQGLIFIETNSFNFFSFCYQKVTLKLGNFLQCVLFASVLSQSFYLSDCFILLAHTKTFYIKILFLS